MWLSSYCTLMNLVMAFLAYCRCITTVLYACMGCMIQQPVSVHLVYSTFCTMVGVALPYQVHVHAAWYGSFCTPGVQYCLYHAGATIQRFPGCIDCCVTFICFAKSTHIDHFVLTFAFLFDSDSHYFLSFYSSHLLYTKSAINPHSTLLPAAYWLYACVESASCLEYKQFLVTC